MFSRQAFTRRIVSLVALTMAIYGNVTLASDPPNSAAFTPLDPVMKCAITQYQLRQRAWTKPPDPDVMAHEIQEINNICGSSLQLKQVHSGDKAAHKNPAATQSGMPDTATPPPVAPPAVRSANTSRTSAAHTKKTSKETVSSVLISTDGARLVVMTSHFHYIFEIPAPVLAALKGSFHPYVRAEFSVFRVDMYGNASGSVSLSVSSAPDNALADALTAGFTKTADGAVFATTLQGHRFAAGNVQPTAQYKLNKTYEIQVEDDLVNYSKPSPIMMAAGYLTIYGILLVVAPQVYTSR